MDKKLIAEEFPVSVHLRFRTVEDRNWFMGGLSDGFGESVCQLEWPHEDFTEAEQRSGAAFYASEFFGVDVFRDEEGT